MIGTALRRTCSRAPPRCFVWKDEQISIVTAAVMGRCTQGWPRWAHGSASAERTAGVDPRTVERGAGLPRGGRMSSRAGRADSLSSSRNDSTAASTTASFSTPVRRCTGPSFNDVVPTKFRSFGRGPNSRSRVEGIACVALAVRIGSARVACASLNYRGSQYASRTVPSSGSTTTRTLVPSMSAFDRTS
jgi:hypothetical protein